jgi:putative oxidoreductase
MPLTNLPTISNPLHFHQLQSSKIHAAARLLMSVLFLVSGVSKLGAPEQTKAYMEAYGVPGYLLYPAAALEIGGAGMLLADYNPAHTRWLAMVLAGWCLLTASIFHTDLKDQEQKINLMKNMAMTGGFLVLAEDTKVKGEGKRLGWDEEGVGTGGGEE